MSSLSINELEIVVSIQVIQKIHLHRHEQSMSNGVKLICEYCDLKAAMTVNLNLYCIEHMPLVGVYQGGLPKPADHPFS